MTREDLFVAIGGIDDALINRSEKVVKRNKKSKIVWYGGMLASAACLLLVIFMAQGIILPESKPPVTSEGSSGNHGGGNGPDHPNQYIPGPVEGDETQEQAYGMDTTLDWTDFNAGPIVPLTFADENNNIIAERELVYDFSAVSQADKGYVPVKDSYVLNNTSSDEQTVTFYYPYISSGNELATHMPKVMLNQGKEEANIINGAYMGTDSQGMMRLFSSYVSTDEFCYMLNEVAPLEEALDMDLLNQKVIVYEFSDFDKGSVPGEAATYAVTFDADKMDQVYYSNMMDVVDSDTGTVTLYFMLDQAMDEEQKPAIYFLGKVPEEYEAKGYVYPEFIEVNESGEVTVDMTERETTVVEMLKTMVDEQMKSITSEDDAETKELKALLYRRVAQMFCDMNQWNTDGETTAEDDVFYANCISDIIYYVFEEESVYLLTDTITIPAGESVTVEFDYWKHGNHQTHEPQENFKDNYCYDNTPSLGTNVNYSCMIATIKDDGNIRIEDQNYGFDLENDIRQVELELDAERYYMIVKFLH